MSGRRHRILPPHATAGVITRYGAIDPGFARTRRGLQTLGASATTWATVSAAASVIGIPDTFRIALYGAGACFFGALMITDPRPSDRIHTFGCASVVAVAALALTVYLGHVGVWAAAVFLVVQMFLSFALRGWSLRAGSLAGIGALTTFVASGGHISADRIAWFMAASTIGFAWLAIWQIVIVPDRSADAARRAIRLFIQLSADVVAAAALTTHPQGAAHASNVLRVRMRRAVSCRKHVDDQLAELISNTAQHHAFDEWRVTLHSMQTALEGLADLVDRPRWAATVGDPVALTISTIFQHLAEAMRVPTSSAALCEVADKVHTLRRHLDELSEEPTAGDERQPAGQAADTVPETLGAADLVVESDSAAAFLESQRRNVMTEVTTPEIPTERHAPPPRIWGLRPTTALAVQAVVASVSAGLIALWVGIEQSRVVAYTAFLVIAASAGTSVRRAWTRVAATAAGATAGVVIASSVPRNAVCIGTVFAVGVFFTVFTAPVSNAAMVFWLSIATVPLAATEGLYLELVKDKTTAALIAGCVAAVVALTVAPIRLEGSLRGALLAYLDELDATLETLPTQGRDDATTGAKLVQKLSNIDAIAASSADETHVFPRPVNALTEQRMKIHEIHQGYLRLIPLVDDSSPKHLGSTPKHVDDAVRGLRKDVEAARAAIRDDPKSGDSPRPDNEPIRRENIP